MNKMCFSWKKSLGQLDIESSSGLGHTSNSNKLKKRLYKYTTLRRDLVI